MNIPSLPLQAALVAALRGNIGEKVAQRVYNKVPVSATFPYVSLPLAQIIPDKADCIDGSEAFPIIHVWSRGGDIEAAGIAANIVAVLDDQPLDVAGFDTVLIELQDLQPVAEPDGLTSHVVLTFRVLLTSDA